MEKLKPKHVYVYEISRLTRSIVDLKSLVDEVLKRGVSIKFIKENMTFAEFERAIITQLVKDIVAISKAQGKYKRINTELCKGDEEIRYNAIVNDINDSMSIQDIGTIYKVGIEQVYKIKEDIK